MLPYVEREANDVSTLVGALGTQPSVPLLVHDI